MFTKLKFKSLIAVALLSGCTSLSTSVDNVIAGTDLASETTVDQVVQADLEGPYLGQNPPSLTPELFAPGIVSTNEHLETEVLFSDSKTTVVVFPLSLLFLSKLYLFMSGVKLPVQSRCSLETIPGAKTSGIKPGGFCPK